MFHTARMRCNGFFVLQLFISAATFFAGAKTGDSYNRGEKIDGSKFGADPGLSAETVPSNAEALPDKETPPTPAYRCKKCRRLVALQENVVDHVPGEGETCFEWHKRRSGNPFGRSDDDECSSIFIEPLRWMAEGMINQLC